MENQFILTVYSVYLPVALLLTFFVAKTLFKNGKVFMIEIFKGKMEIALATNKLFEVGFYLLNMGFALMILKVNYPLVSSQEVMEILSYKLGGFSIYLGLMLFFNLYLFFRGKRKSKSKIQQEMILKHYNQINPNV